MPECRTFLFSRTMLSDSYSGAESANSRDFLGF